MTTFCINRLFLIVIVINRIEIILTTSNQTNVSDVDFSRSTVDSYMNEGDKDCIGNRLEAAEIGRQCSRRCKKDVPCENARKHCLCDGLCGLSCLKPDLTCTDLPPIIDGNFHPKHTVFGTRVTYQCDPGFYLFGSRTRLCQGDEDWSGIPAECMAEPQCHNPLKINHARNPNDGLYRLYDKVNYSCYPGYQAIGNPEASCQLVEVNQTAWVWAGTQFRCIPKSCGDPGQIENGKRQGESFIIASSVLYSCNSGFEMMGQARRYCQSDSQWSGQPPHCEPIMCNPTDHLENGKIKYAAPLVFNSTVEYSCDYGFRLIGLQLRICGPERKLIGDAPRCEEIDCGQLGALHNGYIKGYSSRMGDKKEFMCMDGMKFVGNHTYSICLESGIWSNPLPQCLAPCTIPHVEHATKLYVVPTELVNLDGNITLATVEPGSQISHGSFLEVLCDPSYEIDEHMDKSSSIQAPLCFNETLTYMPQCKPASCKSVPPSPKNGRVKVASIEHGSKGYVFCLDGYRLVGSNVTQCINGNWTSIESSCAEIYCGFPGFLEHGRVLLVGLTGMYDYKPYIRRISTNRQIAYECEVGYRMNDGAPSGATCMDGQWKPDGLPNCIKE